MKREWKESRKTHKSHREKQGSISLELDREAILVREQEILVKEKGVSRVAKAQVCRSQNNREIGDIQPWSECLSFILFLLVFAILAEKSESQ